MTCVVVAKGSQVGYTECLGNIIGFHIDQDPAPILVVQPTVEMAEAWSKDRPAPMIRDTPCLASKVQSPLPRLGPSASAGVVHCALGQDARRQAPAGDGASFR